MKKFVKSFFVAALCMVAMPAFADIESDQADSKRIALELEIAKHELNAAKAKVKLDPSNSQYMQDVNALKDKIELMKSQKKVIDKNIAAQKAQIKAEKAAIKAQQKAEKAAAKAEKAAAKRATLK
ncbi:MAG: hypothetical protein Q4B58_05445 [Bacteroidales bacterium]|nr:hypothetical protein [Bacteroidales bacterium]